MDMNENTVKGKTIYFTGKFELGPQYRAEQLGATIVESISEDVDWVVLGAGHSSTGLEQAHNLGIKLLNEGMFFQLVDPIAWNERCKAREMEAEKRWTAEKENRRAEDEKRCAALEIKRATMPRVRASARIVTDCFEGRGTARLIKEEDFLNLTADQLREAIVNGEHYPIVARDEDGDFLLLCSSAPDDSIDFYPRTAEVLLYDDGSFEVVEVYEDEDEDEDEDDTASS
jgi:hypothetical protein